MDAITINQGCSQKYVEVLGLKVLSDCDDIGVVLSIANYMKRKFETIEVKWSTMTVASIGKLLRKKGVPSTEMRGIFKDLPQIVSWSGCKRRGARNFGLG